MENNLRYEIDTQKEIGNHTRSKEEPELLNIKAAQPLVRLRALASPGINTVGTYEGRGRR
jgi:hypothetical protein